MSQYWDASAILKLVVDEERSVASQSFYEAAAGVSTSRVGVIEVARVARRREVVDWRRVEEVVGSLVVLELGERISSRAGALGPVTLRALDAIHLASALELGPDLDAFVTYDARLAAAARDLGLPVVSPA